MFETAVLRASMPQNDYDIEALIARIAALESKIENGVILQNDGGRVETNAQTAVADTPVIAVEEPKKEETKKRVVSDYFGNGAPEMEAPPDEEVTGGNVYFDESNAPLPKTEPKKTEIKPAPIGDAKATFGTFLRSLRKIGKSGVLFAICMDMEYAYEDGVFTLYTQSDTIYRSLCKDEHQALLKSAFEAIGINQNAFAVKMKGKATDDIDKGLQALKNDFQGVKMDIK
jgi:hypothetical protein